MTGWVALHRCLVNKAIWESSTPEHKTILITLLLMANHKEKQWIWKGRKFEAMPGQFVTSLESIKKKAGKGISIKNVRTAIEKFEKLEFLANESTKTGRLITIVNWGIYQEIANEEGKEIGKEGANEGQRGGKEVATNNNVTMKQCNNNSTTSINSNDNNNNKRSSSAKNFADGSKELLFAAKLKELILQNNPKARVPNNLQNWAYEFDKMMRLDRRTPGEIETVMEFSQKDSFWSTNILSAGTLRKQFDRLYMQSRKKEEEHIGFKPKEIYR